MSALELSNFIMTGSQFAQQQREQDASAAWSWSELSGRLVELRNTGASAVLTFAFSLVFEAQQADEPVAWIAATDSLFYAPDVIENGIDLGALAVICVHGPKAAARAADKLARSGAFGLIILDLGQERWFPAPLQNRLVHLAQEHETAIVCLTQETHAGRRDEGNLDFASLRAEARLERCDDETFNCTIEVRRDKRRGVRWTFAEVCRGPTGLR